MVFNFYFNKDGQPQEENAEPLKTDEMEAIMKKMEIHFADWHDFYQFYMKNAKPPNKQTEKIQDFFNDLREDFVKILQLYNETIHHFADIREVDTQDTEFENQVINQMKSMMESPKKKDDTDSNLNMYG
tara:strand:+ start:3907 stop:4293 length:387 start_codon:yes stop_codon:yes gene_type:complete